LIHFFGYAEHPHKQNDTAFFKYDYSEPQNKAALELFKGFEFLNKNQMDSMRLRAKDRLAGKVVEKIPSFVF
jgi:hypothetical protein